MTQYKTHPALQTDNYVRATTLVPDKYGIIQLSNDLLVAMHEADMSSLKDDTTEDLAKDMGIEAKFKF